MDNPPLPKTILYEHWWQYGEVILLFLFNFFFFFQTLSLDLPIVSSLGVMWHGMVILRAFREREMWK